MAMDHSSDFFLGRVAEEMSSPAPTYKVMWQEAGGGSPSANPHTLRRSVLSPGAAGCL